MQTQKVEGNRGEGSPSTDQSRLAVRFETEKVESEIQKIKKSQY